jgi:transcriptional regulator with XRE-family HTH domain
VEVNNLLLRHLRQKAHFTEEKTAEVLGIDLAAFQAIEKGVMPLSREHAEELSNLFDMDPEVLYASSLQLEMVQVSQELIKRQNFYIEMLTALVNHLRPPKGEEHKR